MKRSRFTETQIVAILKQADAGRSVKELCREHGISEATYYNWKSKYGGMEASDLKRMKELEAENAKLKPGAGQERVLVDGQRLRVLTIVDNFTRESPFIGVDCGEDVVAALEVAASRHGRPRRLQLDNGPECVSRELDLWAYVNDVVLDFSRPGNPTDNAFIEAFNSRFRQEYLNQHWFLSLDDVRGKIEAWRQEYNQQRPHSSLQNPTPMEFAQHHSHADFLTPDCPRKG